MLVDLVQTTTRDGVRLDGVFSAPSSSGSSALGVDAFCFLHGTGGNFYSSSLFDDLGERLRALGCGVLRVNTRGHDGVSTASTDQGGRRQGAAYEVVDHCRYDVAAWLTWLRQRVGPRIGLLGHSMGAIKCLYALAHEPHNAPICAVAVSPPRLSYSWFCSSPEGADFLQTYRLAERHAREWPVRGDPGSETALAVTHHGGRLHGEVWTRRTLQLSEVRGRVCRAQRSSLWAVSKWRITWPFATRRKPSRNWPPNARTCMSRPSRMATISTTECREALFARAGRLAATEP